MLEVEVEDRADLVGLVAIDRETSTLGRNVVAERGHTTSPLPATTSGLRLVPRTFRDQSALVLGEAQQHVLVEAPAWRRRVELLRDADERAIVAIEELNELQEVQHSARQAIGTVDDDAADLARLDSSEEALQRRALHRAAR